MNPEIIKIVHSDMLRILLKEHLKEARDIADELERRGEPVILDEGGAD